MNALSTCQANLAKARTERDQAIAASTAKDVTIADLRVKLAACEGTPTPHLYVSPNGSDTAAGTQAAPLRTVTKLTQMLRQGQTGMLLGGEYRENVDLITPEITLTAEPGITTFRGVMRMTNLAPKAIVEKLIIRATHNYVPLIYGNDQILRECDCSNENDGIGVHITDGGMFPRPKRTTIDGCYIHNNGKLIIPRTNQEHGVYVGQADDGVVKNCLIVFNADRGAQVYSTSTGWLFENSILAYNDRGFGFGGGPTVASSRNTINKCIIAHNKEWNVYGSWEGPKGTGNVLKDSVVYTPQTGQYNGTPANSGLLVDGYTISGLIVADPQFADPSNGNFNCSNPAAKAIEPKLADWLS
jgi:hypothetical protein